jgi:acetyl/propionyl-CoA carboxylase alpha subunit
MGDKAQAKILMKKAGVPTVPGYEGLESYDDFKKAATEIGYPVLVKAAAGGGGKGMRVVNEESELKEAIELAKREALNAFGNESLLIEKYLAEAHHVEIQVFGDKHGSLVHLFERECSVQRRHQKIIEESPSPLLTPELREQMGQAAVNAAKAVNYFNAGTVEFIFDPRPSTFDLRPSFYFLEMNTRLQVEHPVTELVTGLDLVHWQIRVAAGEKFPFTQSDLHQHGHAIECRVYAEDPSTGFLPSTGRLLQFIPPQGPGIRVDSGFAAGDDVTHFYDPLLAKLIVHAGSRDDAIKRIKNALNDFVVHGVVTNIDYMRAVVETDDFKQGRVSTRWVESNFGKWTPAQADHRGLIAAALADVVFVGGKARPAVSNETDPFNPWKQTGNYRN